MNMTEEHCRQFGEDIMEDVVGQDVNAITVLVHKADSSTLVLLMEPEHGEHLPRYDEIHGTTDLH